MYFLMNHFHYLSDTKISSVTFWTLKSNFEVDEYLLLLACSYHLNNVFGEKSIILIDFMENHNWTQNALLIPQQENRQQIRESLSQ